MTVAHVLDAFLWCDNVLLSLIASQAPVPQQGENQRTYGTNGFNGINGSNDFNEINEKNGIENHPLRRPRLAGKRLESSRVGEALASQRSEIG